MPWLAGMDAGRAAHPRKAFPVFRCGRRTHFDAVTLKRTVAPSGLPAELRPAKAIANIPIAKIEPRTAFALSHPSNSRGFLR
jgi:hypothetical protein